MEEKKIDEIVSVPRTLQQQIQRAQNLIDQAEDDNDRGNTSRARSQAELALSLLNTIAQRYPELAALMVVAQQGHQGIEIVLDEERHWNEPLVSKVFGEPFTSMEDRYSRTRTTRTVRFT